MQVFILIAEFCLWLNKGKILMNTNCNIFFRAGLIFSLVTLLFGVGLGVVFGVAEDQVKSHFETLYTDAHPDNPSSDSVRSTSKAWTYIKRAHIHAMGLGAAGLGLAFSLLATKAGRKTSGIGTLVAGIGGLGYGLFWLWAALRIPVLDSSDAAKESLSWLAIPSAGLFGIGVLIGLLAACLAICRCPSNKTES